jgi:hypothetical protein
MGRDNGHPSLLNTRLLIRNNVVRVTGLNGANGRAFQVIGGGSDITIDHNTIINTAEPHPPATMAMADNAWGVAAQKATNFTFTNNLATHSEYGFCGSGVKQGTAALNAYFTNFVFSNNVLVGAPADAYPAGNHFPATVDKVRFRSYAGGDYTLSADSPYKSAATDGTDIGADLSAVPSLLSPNPPSNVAVK